MSGRRIILCAVFALAAIARADTTFIPAGGTWRYLDNGSNQGTAWRASGFADGSWSNGPAQLGYGDGDESTTLGYGPNANNRYITYYFRATFTVSDPSTYIDQRLRLLRDDGAVVYINGTEVRRENMPTGTITYLTLATNAVGGADEDNFFESIIPADSLVAGTNTIAVELHQSATNSSDISFDLVLIGRTGVRLISAGDNWRYLDTGTNLGTAWQASAFDDTAWSNGPAQLGYGDGDEATVLGFGGVPTNKFVTYYFRTAITVPDITGYLDLRLRLLRDDGAVVYVNGTEVRRDNMPTGTITHLTLATSSLDGTNETAFFETVIPVGALVAGTNTIAVEIHQSSVGSSDISFDMELIALTDLQLISAGDSWRYYDKGTNLGTAWRELAYNDTAWSNGPAQLGYGDGDEATVLGYGGNAANKYITYYFRKAVTVANPPAVEAIRMRLLRDDGAVVYINGTEVRRDNMPAGTIGYLTLASSAADDDTPFYDTLFPADGLLAAGTNMVAVEIHQTSPDSSDISFDFELAALSSNSVLNVQVTRGPYLQTGTPTGIVVRWRTDYPVSGTVWYGPDPTNLLNTAIQPTVTTEHEVELAGLDPETKYFYGIGYGTQLLAGAASHYFFVTHPPAGARSFRVWVLGDSGTKDQNARNVRDGFAAWATNEPPDLWLMLGDNAYTDGTDEEFQDAVFEMYTNTLLHAVLWPTLGNHDGHTADSVSQTGPYYDIFTLPRGGEAGGLASGTEAYYSFDYAQAHFICLESYETDRSTNAAMMVWAKNDLAATTQSWIIAFWHHPPYSKGSHNSDTETELVEMRTNALPIFEAAGVDLVLGGHSHAYERSFLLHGHYGVSTQLNSSMLANNGDGRENGDGVYDKTLTNGAVYTVAGSSGQIGGGSLNHPAMFLSTNQLGSVVLDVSERSLVAWFVDDDGTARDWFTLRKDTPVYTLNAAASGPGSVSPATGAFLSNTVVQVTATPSNFFDFGQWTGDVAGAVNPMNVVMNGDKQLTAVFDPILVTNGVPQWWLDEHGFGTEDSDALADQDGDNVFTWAEYQADTDPNAAGSYLRVESLKIDAGTAISFPALTSRIYSLQFRDGMIAGDWSNVPTAEFIAPTNTFQVLMDPAPGTSRFYRLEVDLP